MSRTKRLLVLSSSYPSDLNDGRAAAGFFVKDFVEELSMQHEVGVLTQDTGAGPYENQYEKYTVKRFSWPGKARPLSTLKLPADIVPIVSIMISATVACIRWTRKKRPDHVIALWAIPCGIWALILKKMSNIPYSIWCLGSDIWNYNNSRATRALLKLVLKNASHVYADGFELSKMVNEIAPVDCSFLASSRHIKAPSSRHSLKPGGVRHYLFIGRYHRNKGPDVLVRAIQLLSSDTRSRVHFHFFGGGSLAPELEQLIGESGLENTITLGGFIGETKLAEMLYASDVVVIPSRIDSIPLMLSAAIQMDKAIIATDVGDMGYILKKFGAGRVVPPGSAESIAQAIQHDLLSPDEFHSKQTGLLELLDISNSARTIIKNIN